MFYDFTKRPKDFGILEKINLFDKKYEEWIRSLPCLICKSRNTVVHHNWHRRSNSFVAVPLCVNHHTHGQDSYHKLEAVNFQRKHNICLGWVIINLMSFYLANIKKGKSAG